MIKPLYLGIELQAHQLCAVGLQAGLAPKPFTKALRCDESWPELLWNKPQWLAAGLRELKKTIGKGRVSVAINLPLSCVRHTLVSLPTVQAHQPSVIADRCQRNGMIIEPQQLVQSRWLAGDGQRFGAGLYQVVMIERRLLGVLQTLCHRLHWSLQRIDLSCFARAYAWWHVESPWPGRYAELHVAQVNQTQEVSLFLHKRLLDWRRFDVSLGESLAHYLTQLQLLWRRLSGIELKQIRSLEHLSLDPSPVIIRSGERLWAQHDDSLAAFGAALAISHERL
ncbi:hypothetical protein [Celerinatantimonas yamalensis]|uniref:Pilus assembly protein PilM n=1 Tax=Celerinatantimonas yamalensis TaxID=559956 RepID=A0ABW9G796_9GAMM